MSERSGRPATAKLERAIVLEVLAEEGGRGCSCSELAAALGVSGSEVEAAVRRLSDAGVLESSAERARAGPAARRLDELDLIGI